jgi:pyruvate dehydrogenase E1 component beta subunit
LENYKEAYIAAEELAKKNFMWVVDLRTVRPMDETILTSVKKTNRLVVLEEAWPFKCSFWNSIYRSRACFWLSWCTNTKNYHCWHTSAFSPVLLKEWLPNADDVIKRLKSNV